MPYGHINHSYLQHMPSVSHRFTLVKCRDRLFSAALSPRKPLMADNAALPDREKVVLPTVTQQAPRQETATVSRPRSRIRLI